MLYVFRYNLKKNNRKLLDRKYRMVYKVRPHYLHYPIPHPVKIPYRYNIKKTIDI